MKRLYYLIIGFIFLYGPLFAQVSKSGVIDGEIWTAEDSLYIITGNIAVIDLTIEPGVIIQFEDNYKFEVDGTLRADGFHSDSIYFQPHLDNSAGWEGFKFKNTATSSSLKYCRIEGSSKHGINIDQVQPEISNCRIVGSTESGIFLKGTSLQLQHCIISNNVQNGIETDDSQVTVLNSIISENGESGILSTNNNDIINVINVVIADNKDRGIDCPDGDLTVRNSIIYYNSVQIDTKDGIINVTYSDVQGASVFPGLGNINAIPDFLERRYYTLSSQSPRSECIDAGNPNFAYTDVFFPPSLGTSLNDLGAYGGPQAFGWYPPLYIKPQSYNFNRVTQDTSRSTVLNILNYRDEEITVSEILFDDDDIDVFSNNPDSFSVEISDSVDLAVTFTPESERGYNSDLILQTESHGTVSIPLSGEGVLPHINIPSSELTFGPVQLGEDGQLELPIVNLGGDTLYIHVTPPSLSNYTLDKNQFSINPDLGTETITVTFTPDSARAYEDSFLIVSNDRDRSEIKVSLNGLGLGPEIELDQQTLDFDSVAVLSDSVLFLNIRNNGNDILRINNLTIEPSNSGFAFTDAPITFPLLVEVGSSIDLSIQFSPLERGPLSAELSIYSNNPFQNMLTVDLSGTGLAPLLLLSSSDIEFDSVPLTSDSTINLTVFNLGNDLLHIDSLFITPSDDVFKMTDTTISFPYIMETETNVTFPIRFEPMERGITSARITLISNDPFQGTALIDLSGEGVAAGINLSTYTLSFGSVPIDSDSVQNLIIYNTIETRLTIDSIVTDPRNSVFTFADTTVIFPHVIDPGDSLIFPIRFKPTLPDSVSADLQIFSDDPFQEKISVQLSGRGIDTSPKPYIFLSSNFLEFNEVDTNSYAQKNLYVYNIGDDDLIIPEDSIYIKDSVDDAFSIINISEEIRVRPQDSLGIIIRFEPSYLGPVQNILQIKSNDPLNPEMEVTLSGTGIGPILIPEIKLSTDILEFNQVDTSTFDQKILYIFNIGNTTLNIPVDSIFISESDNDAFLIMNVSEDISINPNDSLDIMIRFQPSEIGPVQDTLIIKSDDPVYPTRMVLLSGTGIGNGLSSISFNQENSTNPLINRQPATMSFEINSSAPIDSAVIFVRRGGEISFTVFLLQRQGTTSIWSAEIESNLITERGVEYYVIAYQSQTFSVYPQNGESHPITLSVQMPYLAFPDEIPAKTYRMISIPFYTPGQTLSDLFADNLGPYNDSNYRIFECTSGEDYTEIREMNKPLPPGKSVWLISKDPVELDITNGESVSTDKEYMIELHQGWNMISTPFAFPVSWIDIGTGLALRHYDGGDWPFSTIMEPYKGYAVNTSKDTVISVSTTEALILKSLPKPIISRGKDNWEFQISAECDNIIDRFNYVGTIGTATSGVDRFDHPEPLPIGDYISLYLLAPENNTHLSTDYRQPDSDGYIFDIEMFNNIGGNKTIEMVPNNLPDSYDWMVLSSVTKVNHKKNPVQTSSNRASYKLIVGTSAFINDNISNYKSLPTEYKLAPNFPNPFNPSTKISYQLPISSEIEISIYNILGQRVATMVSDRQEAGYYQLEWNGLNRSDQQVSSGIYFLHLQTKQFTKTIKMILQR